MHKNCNTFVAMDYSLSLEKYFPAASLEQIRHFIKTEGFQLHLYSRKSGKYGYYRRVLLKKPVLAVNVYYGKQVSLFTFLHELAHHEVHKIYGNRRSIKPHGKEWKSIFTKISVPFLNEENFDVNILGNLYRFFRNPKARINVESLFSMKNDDEFYLKEVRDHELFLFRNKRFKRLEKKRTRILCQSLENSQKYLISQDVLVKKSIHE